ncbi:MAG: hypothetical protein KJO12_08330, partial [Ignavibacteria bacterium]|nr:hypothetical protein [Ignavibacteria bacterium]
MKISIFFTLVTISPLLLSTSFTSNSCFDNNDIETVIQELYEEVIAVRTTFNRDQLLVSYRQKQLKKRIQSELSTEIKLACN